jgi:hypothetical protein
MEQNDTASCGVSSPRDNSHPVDTSSPEDFSTPHYTGSVTVPVFYSRSSNLTSTPFSSSENEVDEREYEEDGDAAVSVSTEEEEKDFTTEKEITLHSSPETSSTARQSPSLSAIEQLVDEVVDKVDSFDFSAGPTVEKGTAVTTGLKPGLKHFVEIILTPQAASPECRSPSNCKSPNPRKVCLKTFQLPNQSKDNQITPSLSISKAPSITATKCTMKHCYKVDGTKSATREVSVGFIRHGTESASTVLANARDYSFHKNGLGCSKDVAVCENGTAGADPTTSTVAESSRMDSNIVCTLMGERRQPRNDRVCRKLCKKCNRPKKIRIASSNL